MNKRLNLILLFAAACVALHAQQTQETGLFLRAVAEFSEGAVEPARLKFEALHEQSPQDDAVSYYLGMCEMYSGNPAAAELHLKEAFQRDTTNEWYVYALVTLYNGTGNRTQFANWCERLIEMNPGMYSNPYTLSLIGDVRLSQRLDDTALSYYEKALEIAPDYTPAELGRIEALRLIGNNPAFFAALDGFVSKPQVRPDIKSDYIEAIVRNMDSKFYWVWGAKLAELVDTCLELHPGDVKSNLLKVQLLTIEQKYDDAIEQCARLAEAAAAASDTASLALAYNLEGDLAHETGDMRRTYRAYDMALEVDPDCAAVLNNYAYFLSLERRSLRKALKMSRRAVELEPDNATYLDTLGWILYLKGRPEEAKPHFKRAMIYGGKDSSEVLGHYSEVLKALGEDELASYYENLSQQKSR
ncbi:MAG TPA: hypothetical protein IAC98_03095 [Candidatus Cryptobacteroides pullicola]|nr:hypothetical protein [Candidatus Cryptobacteroides pullicola]